MKIRDNKIDFVQTNNFDVHISIFFSISMVTVFILSFTKLLWFSQTDACIFFGSTFTYPNTERSRDHKKHITCFFSQRIRNDHTPKMFVLLQVIGRNSLNILDHQKTVENSRIQRSKDQTNWIELNWIVLNITQ